VHLPTLPAIPIFGLRSRILAVFVLVIVGLQVGGFVLIDTFGTSTVRKTVTADVVAGTRVFERLLEIDAQRLIEGTRVLTGDPQFRELAVAGDPNELAPALATHGKRIAAAVMLLVGTDYRVVAGTLEAEVGRRVGFPKLVDRAAAAQQASGMVPIAGQLYQLAIVPIPGPKPAGWVVAGIKVNDAMAQELGGLARLDVSILGRFDEGDWRMAASTRPSHERAALTRDVAANRYSRSDSEGNAEYGNEAVSRVVNLSPRTEESVVAVLQAPLAAALEPFRRMQLQLAAISVVGALAAIAVGLAVARWVVGPVRELAGAARRGAAGDYEPIAPISRTDEVGELAKAFRLMQEGVAGRMSKMTDLAHRDALTGLPTRVLFADRLQQAIANASRAGSSVAVLVLDLDNFGHVNDTLGHPIGDLLLREVAARLRSVVRRASDSVARIGADEFAIVMPGSGASDAQRAANAILRAFDVKMTLDGHLVDVGVSIGIAASPDHGSDPVQLFERADVAMRAAKHDKIRLAVWDPRFDEHGEERLSLLSDLRKAVDNDELALIYQPKIALGECGEHFVEALVRWQHPKRGLVPPSDFIPLAEQTGYIRSITEWVLARAIAQCAQWRGRGLPMNVSVNISARDLIDSELPVRLARILEHEGCSAQWLTLEISENAIVGEPGHALKNLERLHELGCRLAVDDYGTGYSSLAYLRRLPLNELQIDKSFIMGMTADASDALIVRSTIELAHKLGLSVVAGGVEDEATLEQLRALGCDGVQGFLFSRPLLADDVPAWVRESPWARPAREKGALRRVS